MKLLLVALSAKYIHSNLAVHSLEVYVKNRLPELEVQVGEYSIQEEDRFLLQEIAEAGADVVAFSSYIWNIRRILLLAKDSKRICPGIKIWLGGPEAGFRAEEILNTHPEIDGIMRGEGEETICLLMEALIRQRKSAGEEPAAKELAGKEPAEELAEVTGITYRDGAGAVRENPPTPLLSMDALFFVYGEKPQLLRQDKILYYESSRGCPYSCSYCLSSVDKKVRFRSTEKVKKELSRFLSAGVSQVKFIDRTFNVKKEHTLGIWRHIMKEDNGITNFHFEIEGDRLCEEEVKLLTRMRKGLVQLEIGVQSTNEKTQEEIRRYSDIDRLEKNVGRLIAAGNMHIHLDLIAGLPYENLESFIHSFNRVYRMAPTMLQLGFLKVLAGSPLALKAADYDLVKTSDAPHEVLSTKWISYRELCRLHGVEEMVEVYYNSRQFVHILERFLPSFADPFSMYDHMADYYKSHGYDRIKHNRLARYRILFSMMEAFGLHEKEEVIDSFLTDLYLRERLRSRPDFLPGKRISEEVLRRYMNRKKLPVGQCHLEPLFDGRVLLVDYRKKDPISGNFLFEYKTLSEIVE